MGNTLDWHMDDSGSSPGQVVDTKSLTITVIVVPCHWALYLVSHKRSLETSPSLGHNNKLSPSALEHQMSQYDTSVAVVGIKLNLKTLNIFILRLKEFSRLPKENLPNWKSRGPNYVCTCHVMIKTKHWNIFGNGAAVQCMECLHSFMHRQPVTIVIDDGKLP